MPNIYLAVGSSFGSILRGPSCVNGGKCCSLCSLRLLRTYGRRLAARGGAFTPQPNSQACPFGHPAWLPALSILGEGCLAIRVPCSCRRPHSCCPTQFGNLLALYVQGPEEANPWRTERGACDCSLYFSPAEGFQQCPVPNRNEHDSPPWRNTKLRGGSAGKARSVQWDRQSR